MAAKNKSKYSYGESGSKDLYGVDAPDNRENDIFQTYLDTVKAIIYASDGMTSRAIKSELGDLNDEQLTSSTLERLCASDDVDEIRRGSLVFYARAEPREPIKQPEIDGAKLAEYTKWKQREGMTYANGF